MKHIKLFESFVNEGMGQKTFKDQVLTALEPTILQICERMKQTMIRAYAEKGIDYKWTEFDEQMTRISVIVDMLKSFQKYTQQSDQLVTLVPREGGKGIEITAQIERDGQLYDYYTHAIYAGGYHIQREHLRYLTKTKLPKVNSDLASEYINKMKGLKKAERVQMDIREAERQVKYLEDRIAERGHLTDEQWSERLEAEGHWAWDRPDWKDVDKKHNFNNDENVYNAEGLRLQQEYIQREKVKVERDRKYLKDARKRVEKLKVKLESLL
jgi:hypothetical protein